jgi:hypothetical protein
VTLTAKLDDLGLRVLLHLISGSLLEQTRHGNPLLVPCVSRLLLRQGLPWPVQSKGLSPRWLRSARVEGVRTRRPYRHWDGVHFPRCLVR